MLPEEIEKLYLRGINALNEGNFPESIPLFKSAISKIKQLDNDRLLPNLWQYNKQIGYVYFHLGDFDDALNYYNDALEIAKKLGNNVKKCRILNAIGVVQEKKGNYDEAMIKYEESYSISLKFNILICKASALNNMALIHKHWGNTRKAITLFEKALELNSKTDDYIARVIILNNIGEAKNILGTHNESLRYHKNALNLCHNITVPGKRTHLGTTLHHLGYTYELWGKFEQALQNYFQAFDIRKSLGEVVGSINSMNNIAGVYRKIGNYEESLIWYKNALVFAEKKVYLDGIAKVTVNLGSLYIETGEYIEAKNNLDRADQLYAEIKNFRGIMSVEIGRANLFIKEKNCESSLDIYFRYLKLSQETYDIRVESTISANIGYVYFLKGDFEKSAKYMKEAFMLRDKITQTGISPDIRIYSRIEQNKFLSVLVKSLLETGKKREALSYIEQARGREFISSTIEVRTSGSTDELSELQKLNKLNGKISGLRNTLMKLVFQWRAEELNKLEYENQKSKLEQKLNSLFKKKNDMLEEFWSKFPSYGILFHPSPMKIFESLKKIMRSNWVILDFYYCVVTEEIFVFYLRKSENIEVFKEKLHSTQLKELIEQYSEFLGNFEMPLFMNEKNLIELGSRLYELLIPTELKTKLISVSFDILTIIPTREMHSFPLELLHDGSDFWGLQHRMSRAFNFHTLIESSYSNLDNLLEKVLLVGNPTKGITIPKSELFDVKDDLILDLGLENSTKEIQNIERILRSEKHLVFVLEGENAQFNTVISKLNTDSYSLIHFSGHGFYDFYNPEISFLLLRDGDHPKKLFSNEIPLLLRLPNNSLIVLSACETGKMKILSGDEVIGLAKGFTSAGSKSIIFAGWPVFDDSANDFFTSFYRNIVKRKSLVESLLIARRYVHNRAVNKDENKRYEASKFDLLHWAAYRYYGFPN